MKSILNEDLREKFFIKLYFNTEKGHHIAGIKRAFLDFSRTLKIVNEDRDNLKHNAENFILNELSILNQTSFSNQEEFDIYHQNACTKLIEVWSELKYGQSQKWINMTLKYWLLLGEKHIPGIEKNSKYFHIPIDRYVQKGMFEEINPNAWSKIEDYQTYFNYQLKHREKKTGNYPIVDEFEFFNKYVAK